MKFGFKDCCQLGWSFLLHIMVCDGVRILGLFLSLATCGLGVCGNGSIGCTNNNYASREKCKKCGQPKEVAAVPAVAISAASLPTHPHYFARVPGLHTQRINLGYFGNGAPQQSLPLSSGWPLSRTNNDGVQPAVQPVPTWPLGGIPNNGISFATQANQLMVQKGWRNGDWICKCGFHNYSSRLQV